MKSSAITIMLCTCNRASMLREALASIRRQTARDSIARIVVSENSLNDNSKDICAEFSDLPIYYVQQRPPVPPLQHLKVIWHLVETPLVAILHDDDWWAPDHLKSALDVLQEHTECVAVFSSFLESYALRGYSCLNQVYYFAWLAAGCDFSSSVVFLETPDLMLGCLINAGYHYSTAVGRTESMWYAFSSNIMRGNAFDNDRTFPVFLGQRGIVGYVTAPNVFVRQHPNRDAWSVENLSRRHMDMANETTMWLMSEFPDEVALAAAKFNRLARELDASSADEVWNVLRDGIAEPQWSTLIKGCGVDLKAMNRPLEHSLLPKWASNCISALCPPCVYRFVMNNFWEYLMLVKKRMKRT